jgi:hypothetical protein
MNAGSNHSAYCVPRVKELVPAQPVEEESQERVRTPLPRDEHLRSDAISVEIQSARWAVPDAILVAN